MKKIMIGILILVPLVVLLMVGLVTTFVSVRAEIGVDRVILEQKQDIEFRKEPYKLDELFDVTVLPEKATNKEYGWYLENVRNLDPLYDDTLLEVVRLLDASGEPLAEEDYPLTGAGYLEINGYCSFDVVVAAGDGKTDRVTVIVTSEKVASVQLSGEKNELKTGESMMLNAAFSPADSAVTDSEWTSTDTSVLTVDGNGVVTAVGEGKAGVYLTVPVGGDSDAYVRSADYEIIVSKGDTLFGREIYVHESSFALASIGVDYKNIADYDGRAAAISPDGTFNFKDGYTSCTVTLANGNEIVVKKCDADAVTIENADFYDRQTSEYVLSAGDMPLKLNAVYLSVLRRGENVADSHVTGWKSDDENVASVDGAGTVQGITGGQATISLTVDGRTASSVSIEVQKKVSYVILDVSDSLLQSAGVGRQTVFASSRYDGSVLVDNSLSIGILAPGKLDTEDEDNFYNAFKFYAEEGYEKYVRFENNRMYFNREAFADVEGMITFRVYVEAKYPKYESRDDLYKVSFSVNVVNGVQATTYNDMKNALEAGLDVCLGDKVGETGKITVAVDESGKAYRIRSKGSLYGNGWTVEAPVGTLNAKSKTEPIICVYSGGVTISNVTLRANTFDGNDSDMDAEIVADTFKGGYCIRFNRGEAGVDILKDCRVEFCILENATSTVQLKGSEVEFEGCVIRNTSGVAIHVGNEGTDPATNQYNKLTMENCVMSNMIGLAINFDYNSVAYAEDAEKYPERVSTFTQKGFLDIYNWNPIDNLTLLPDDILESELPGMPIDFVKTAIQDIIAGSKITREQFIVYYNGIKQIHMGFMAMGLKRPQTLYPNNITMEDERFSVFNSDELDGGLGSILSQILKEPIYFWCYNNKVDDLTPDSKYSVNTNLINRLHGNY